MDGQSQTHWRKMFERGGNAPSVPPNMTRPASSPLGGYDDGYQQPHSLGGGPTPLSHADITEEAAMALALDTNDYKPWVLQRGRSRPPMMLHLRRFEPRSGKWMGWQVSYPHLIAVEYVGDTMLSLDFGTRHFVIEGVGLDEVARRLQDGSVLAIQEYAQSIWPSQGAGPVVVSVRRV